MLRSFVELVDPNVLGRAVEEEAEGEGTTVVGVLTSEEVRGDEDVVVEEEEDLLEEAGIGDLGSRCKLPAISRDLRICDVVIKGDLRSTDPGCRFSMTDDRGEVKAELSPEFGVMGEPVRGVGVIL